MPAAALVELDAGGWDALLDRAGVTDVYYSRGYVEASAPLAGGAPAFLHLPGDGGHVLFPCLVRERPRDVVSPYGYGGPLAVGPDPPVAAFADAYAGWCERRGVVTSFVTYHPLFANAALAAPTGFRALPLQGTVAWALDRDDLLAGMHRHHRRAVRRARELAVAVEPAPAVLDEFAALYEATMRRAGASGFYLFGPAYWRALRERVPLVRVDVLGDGELLASVLGMGRPPWLHYHLGASSDAGRRAGASHRALYELARWGRGHGFTVLHLGGGVGGRADSLLEFKLRFAPGGRLPAAVGKAVHDLPAYERLSGSPGVDWDAFFPAYRAAR